MGLFGSGSIGYLSGVPQSSFRSFEAFALAMAQVSLPRECLYRDGEMHHVLCTAQFERGELLGLVQCARAIRELDREADGAAFLRGTLQGRRIMHWFGQPSTRTAQSFLAAAHKLGAQGELVTELAKSSMAKGESVEDSVRVMAELFDALVIRHAEAQFSYRALWGLGLGRRSIPVISAGMGPHEHVSQSVLDLLTLEDAWQERGGVQGKRLLIVGDISRNRAARSVAFAFAICQGAAIDWVCPEAFAPDAKLVSFLNERGVEQAHYPDLASAIAARGNALDAVYMTRLQQEWDEEKGSGKLGTASGFVLTPDMGKQLREDCRILHPLPRVNELPSAWDQDPRLSIWEQVKNGMWARAAILATVLGQREVIMARAGV